VGESNEGFKRVRGGKGYGKRNEEGEHMLEMAESTDLFVANTAFQKRDEHKITFKSGNNRSQIDYILVRRRDR
jgi:hypothetical protein